jgi:hypothetical protein
MSQKTWVVSGVAFVLSVLSYGCQAGGVGDPCTPEDEYQPTFSGYAVTEVNLESKSFQCETRLCLVNHFQGRVSCPYGQSDKAAALPPGATLPTGADNLQGQYSTEKGFCHIPGTTTERITVAVNSQYQNRRPLDAVYCSCRCDGPDTNARYCKCPTGFQCVELLRTVAALPGQELAGSYCVKENTAYVQNVTPLGNQCTVSDATTDTPGLCNHWDGSE